MSSALATILFGLAASLSWGSGDFCGGLASRRLNSTIVVICAYSTGFLLLIGLALIWREVFPSPLDIFWGILSGLVGGLGLILFYSALAVGRMGIIAPTSAILTAGLPVIFSIFTQGAPSLLQIGGFVAALLAVVLISSPEREKGRPKGIWLALISGCCFGGFFILISRIGPHSTFWPLAVARLSSVVFLLLLTLFRRKNTSEHSQAEARLGRSVIFLILGSGTLDALGNAFFVLAAHAGRLDVASVLSSLYPAATVLLAALLLRERVNRLQGLGILFALIAIPLISF
ncbi:MAG TPA: EamA family transporter [Ktedonobacteraceae bacterium]|jgi:drug/metabolite transporter (DMT)-like permease